MCVIGDIYLVTKYLVVAFFKSVPSPYKTGKVSSIIWTIFLPSHLLWLADDDDCLSPAMAAALLMVRAISILSLSASLGDRPAVGITSVPCTERGSWGSCPRGPSLHERPPLPPTLPIIIIPTVAAAPVLLLLLAELDKPWDTVIIVDPLLLLLLLWLAPSPSDCAIADSEDIDLAAVTVTAAAFLSVMVVLLVLLWLWSLEAEEISVAISLSLPSSSLSSSLSLSLLCEEAAKDALPRPPLPKLSGC